MVNVKCSIAWNKAQSLTAAIVGNCQVGLNMGSRVPQDMQTHTGCEFPGGQVDAKQASEW